MKKFVLLVCIFGFLPLFGSAACDELAKRYEAPNPASRTMKQIERWVRHKIANPKDAEELKECLLSGAADNPNQSSYAGK